MLGEDLCDAENEFLSQSRVSAQEVSAEVAPVAQISPKRKLSDLKPHLDEFARRAQHIVNDNSRRVGRATVVTAAWLRDLTMRPSFSVAAGIVFAFLLGFWAATGKHQPTARPTTPDVEANVSSASVVPASTAAPVTKKASVTPASKVRKPSPVKQAAAKANDEGFQEVVVRHYPNRGNIAKTESPNKVKQYSDIDEQ